MDPFSTGLLINAGGSLLSSLFAKSPPAPQPLQQFQSQIPQFQPMAPYQQPGAYQSPGAYQPFQSPGAWSPNTTPSLYDVSNSSLYQGLQSQLGQMNAGGSALPQAYQQAVMGQAAQNYGLINDRLKQQNLAQANLHGILNSGGAQEMNARQDESYLREMSNVQSNLNQQDLAQRNQVMAMLQQLEGQRVNTSQTAYGLGLQQSGQQNQYNLGASGEANQYGSGASQYNLGLAGQQNQYAMNSAQQANAYNQALASMQNQYALQGTQIAGQQQQLQYGAAQNQANFGNNQFSNILQGAGNMYNAQGMGQMFNKIWNNQGAGNAGFSGGGAWNNADQGWRATQTAAGNAISRVGFAGS